MRAAFRHIVRGCGFLPNCGYHPGTPLMLLFVMAAFLGGELAGLLIVLFVFGPAYLYGAYSRSTLDAKICADWASKRNLGGENTCY